MPEDVTAGPAPAPPAPTSSPVVSVPAGVAPGFLAKVDPPTSKPAGAPDAILVGRNYPKGKVAMDRHYALKNEFAPVFGAKLIYTRHCGLTESFITADPNLCHRYWPKNHANADQEFYDWKDRGDGVLYGTLTADAKAYLDEQSQA